MPDRPLEGAFFGGTHLEGVNFKYAHMEGAVFSRGRSGIRVKNFTVVGKPYPKIVDLRVFVQSINPTVFSGYKFSHFGRFKTAY